MTKAKTRAPVGKIAAAQNTVKPSKYRVEAEKNLDRVLPASPSNNTILIVDDADDLFGKRSPPKPQ